MEKQKILRIVFIFTLGIIFFLFFFTYSQINSLIDSGQLVNRTTQVKMELESVINDLKDAGNGLGGYMLTQDKRFLNGPYSEAGLKQYPLHLERLNKLTLNNPEQQKNLRVLEKLAESREKNLLQIAALSNSGEASVDMVISSKNILDSLRYQVDKMILLENEYLVSRTGQLKQKMSVAPNSLFAMSIASLIILLLAFWQLNKQMNKIKWDEKVIKLKNEKLEKANEELSAFVYVSSHDLQEPLRKIQLFSQRILDKENTLTETGRNDFQRIINSAERMQQLIKDLLSYSKTDKDEDHFEKTDLNELLKQVQVEFQEQLNTTNATLECNSLPVLSVIPFQVKQLFTNLISNSIKFAKPGTPLQIQIHYELVKKEKTEEKNLYHQFTFKDNGIGFNPKYNEQIFGVFQRLHPNHVFDGTGIGLAICQKIVENHHGFIHAEGRENLGATFHIYLPV